MRGRVIWPLLFAFLALVLAGLLLLEKSWIPLYGETEHLYPLVEDFGGDLLLKSGSAETVSPEQIHDLLKETKFQKLRQFGVVLFDDPAVIVTLCIKQAIQLRIRK